MQDKTKQGNVSDLAQQLDLESIMSSPRMDFEKEWIEIERI